MNVWGLLADLFVTLFGTFVGVFLAFWLDRRSREAEAVRRYANTLNSIRADLANLWAIIKQASDHLSKNDVPFHLIPPDIPAVNAALANSAFYDRAPYGLTTCLIVLSNLHHSFCAAFGDNVFSLNNARLKPQIEQLLRVISHIQRVADEEAKPLGKPLVRTPQDVAILDELRKAMRGNAGQSVPDTAAHEQGAP